MLKTFIGALTLGLALVSVGPVRAAENDCKIAKKEKGENDVTKACEAGGIKRAKQTMKAMAKIAKENGMKTDCDSCHKNEEDWTLTSNAEADFKKLVDIVNKANAKK